MNPENIVAQRWRDYGLTNNWENEGSKDLDRAKWLPETLPYCAGANAAERRDCCVCHRRRPGLRTDFACMCSVCNWDGDIRSSMDHNTKRVRPHCYHELSSREDTSWKNPPFTNDEIDTLKTRVAQSRG